MNYFSKNRWVGIALLFLVLLNLGTLTTLWLMRPNRMGPPAKAGSGVVDFIVQELGFDSAQKKQLILLREEHQQKIREVRRKNRDAKNVFFALLKDSSLSEEALDKAAIASAAYDAETDKLTFLHFREIRKICTPEQQKKFDLVIQEVLRMIAPPPPDGNPPGGPNGRRREGPPPADRRDGPPPGDDHRPPPPEE
ncbi:MAG: periplasmic heavy metal sensor [Bacteroidota bacterium]|nr:periplasmic heavy metal sensor [Bacteroidota bacterium]